MNLDISIFPKRMKQFNNVYSFHGLVVKTLPLERGIKGSSFWAKACVRTDKAYWLATSHLNKGYKMPSQPGAL